jgi:hypothetical protein
VGARIVDVVRLRRLDRLNVGLEETFTTAGGLPAVVLDRSEITVARELPAMYGHTSDRTPTLNHFDKAALGQVRALLEARLGPGLAPAVADLAERDRLLQVMRSRFRHDRLSFNPPDGLVLGERWLGQLAPYAEYGNPGGQLVFEPDLRSVARADEKLRAKATVRVLTAAVDYLALPTEAHEAWRALDARDEAGPPPSQLFEMMENASTEFIGVTDREMRLYLGELRDAASPPCLGLAQMLRQLYGEEAAHSRHYFAAATILRELDADPDPKPEPLLATLCALPEAELRGRVGSAWQKLYGSAMPPARH